jgi:hypothetical protein
MWLKGQGIGIKRYPGIAFAFLPGKPETRMCRSKSFKKHMVQDNPYSDSPTIKEAKRGLQAPFFFGGE